MKFLKHSNAHRDKIYIFVDNDKFHLSMIKEYDMLKLYRHARVNSRGLTNNALAKLSESMHAR